MTDSADPKVSIVIPAYNAAAFIERTLASVKAQTFTDYEVVVVDDGSSDATKETVEAFLHKNALGGRCIRQTNKKIAAARNQGMRSSQGFYIAFLDHDDIWYPKKLEKVIREFGRKPTADLICHNENVVRSGKTLRTTKNGPAVPAMYEALLLGGNSLSASAVVVKKDVAMSVGGFREDEQYNTVEDYDFWLRLSRVAKFHFIDEALGEYALLDGGASHKVEYHHKNLEALLRVHLAAYFGEQPGWLARWEIRRRLAAVYRSALGQLLENKESPEKQKEYTEKMLRAFPLDPKNLVRAFQWGARTLGASKRIDKNP